MQVLLEPALLTLLIFVRQDWSDVFFVSAVLIFVVLCVLYMLAVVFFYWFG